MSLCCAENTQQSRYSPSCVHGDEILAYCILDPDHIEHGEFKNYAFSKSVLRAGKLSVVRSSYADKAEIDDKIVGPQMARDPNRTFLGALIAVCSDIRSMKQNAEREICVVDDGLPELIGHAHLGFSSEIIGAGKSVQTAVRGNLLDLFKEKGIIRDI